MAKVNMTGSAEEHPILQQTSCVCIEPRKTYQVGLLICSPLFAEASKHYNAFRLIAIGLGVWTLATAGCGVAVGAGLLSQASGSIFFCLCQGRLPAAYRELTSCNLHKEVRHR